MCRRALVRSWFASAVRVADTLCATEISRGASVVATRVGGGGGFATCGAATGISREATVAGRVVGGAGFAACGGFVGVLEARLAAPRGDGAAFASAVARAGGAAGLAMGLAAGTELADTMGGERFGIDATGARASTAIEPPELRAATAPGPLFALPEFV